MAKTKKQTSNNVNTRIVLICVALIAIIALIIAFAWKPSQQNNANDTNDNRTEPTTLPATNPETDPEINQEINQAPTSTNEPKIDPSPVTNKLATVIYYDDNDQLITTEATILETGDNIIFQTETDTIERPIDKIAIRVENPDPPEDPFIEYAFKLVNFGEDNDFFGDSYYAINDENCRQKDAYIVYTTDYIYEMLDLNAYLISLDPSVD